MFSFEIIIAQTIENGNEKSVDRLSKIEYNRCALNVDTLYRLINVSTNLF